MTERHSSNRGNHPVLPDRENTYGVFCAILETLPEGDRKAWVDRWDAARAVERKRRDYDRSWDRSLATINWGR